jgi:hypothetical protein
MANKSAAKIWVKHFFPTTEENKKSVAKSSFPTLEEANKSNQTVAISTLFGVVSAVPKVS